VLFSGDGAGVADPIMRERRERRVEKERGRGLGLERKKKRNVWRGNEWSREGVGVYKISCKQFYENAPNNITHSNLRCYMYSHGC
jgi:hypothetical protein